MANLFHSKYSKDYLLKRVGDISQFGGVKSYELSDGNEKGVEAVDFRTGTGFNFTVLPGRGMDISFAEYRGTPLCWVSPTGNVSPAFFEPHGRGWLRSFFGGLLTTCGLTNAGASGSDMGRELNLHGRVSNIPAKNVHHDGEWENDEFSMFVQGKVREVSVFEENILLTRKISATLGESRLFIDDVVENCGHEKTEHMILYHINIGFPLLNEHAKLITPAIRVQPRDEDARVGEKEYNTFSAPVHGYKEQCFYHEMKAGKDGNVTVALINKNFEEGKGLGIYVKYNKNELPWFIEWKMMGEGMYVVGLEPANCLVGGRAKERETGRLQFLEPGEKREYHLEIGVLDTPERIAEIEK